MYSVEQPEINYDKRSTIRLAFNEAFVPVERRMAARIEYTVDGQVYSWHNHAPGDPIKVRIEEFSVTGVGLTSPGVMGVDDEFMIRIPQHKGEDLKVILTVIRCIAYPNATYRVGLRLSGLFEKSQIEKIAAALRDQRRQMTHTTLCLFMLFGITGIGACLLIN